MNWSSPIECSLTTMQQNEKLPDQMVSVHIINYFTYFIHLCEKSPNIPSLQITIGQFLTVSNISQTIINNNHRTVIKTATIFIRMCILEEDKGFST